MLFFFLHRQINLLEVVKTNFFLFVRYTTPTGLVVS